MTDFTRTGHSETENIALTASLLSTLAHRAELHFEEVYEEHFDFVWRNARALGGSDANADDIAQEAFIIVHRKLSSFEGRASLRTWLMSIVVNCVRDSRRRERRKGGHLPLDEELRDGAPDPARIAETKGALAAVRAILDRMNEDQRTVFALIDMQEMSAPETAELLAIPLNTVYSRLRLAREFFEKQALRTGLHDEGSAS